MYAPYDFFKDRSGEEPPRKPRPPQWNDYKGRQRYAPARFVQRPDVNRAPERSFKPVRDANPARSMNLWG